ncbi:hypothetical protein [Burkholderia sp. BCC1972]|uniref:hypothetical protein n=1 Tax=Burkholderia sp. BCC1972 TaxID=2817438 RepID=UPI002ABD4ED5|nr:hypothetical protein [Burkholderia sp. BCC1972]
MVIGYIGPAIIIFISLGLAINFNRPDYGRCDFYDRPETMDGGVKNMNGVPYRFKMCGTGGNDQDATNDNIELRVFSEKGELLARRYFSVNWHHGKHLHPPLSYEGNLVRYIDLTDESNYTKHLKIPPSKWDWLLARLPLFSRLHYKTLICNK